MRPLTLLLAAVLVAGCAGGDGDATPASPPSAARVAPPAELPVPRTEVAGAAWRGLLAVAGGLTADGAASDLVHLYDAGADVWREGPRLPRPLHHAGMAVLADRLYVVGGYTNLPGGVWQPQAAVTSLGPGEARWREEPPLPGGARGALGVAAAGGLLVAAGGEAGGRPLARTEVFDPVARAWRSGPDLARAREHLAVAAAGGRVFAVAGRTAVEGNLAVVESLDPRAGGEWRREPEVGHPRGGIGADQVGGRICVAGGEEATGTIGSVECLDGGGWRVVARLQRPRHGLAVMARDGRLHVVAGGERPGLFVSGVHEVLVVPGNG